MRALILAALVAASPAFADLEARQGSDRVRFMESACTDETVLARIEPTARKEYRAAAAHFQGQDYAACWRPSGNVMHLVYADGDQGIVPMQDLKPVLDV